MNPQQYPQQPQVIMPGQQAPGQQMTSRQMLGQQVPSQQMPGQQVPNQQIPSQQMPGQQMSNQQIPSQQMPGQQMPGQQMPSQQMPGQVLMPQMPQNQQAPMSQQGFGQGPNTTTQAQVTPAPTRVENPSSTQATILISELRDNVVIMKDGSFRAVVACRSINFDLMSDVEREGVEYSYQNFLNSLKFAVQILVRSQRVDIGPYIEKLSEIRRNNDNMLLGVLMDDYINFIDILSQEANIMDKSFFIVIPYYTSAEAEKDLQETKNFFKMFSRAKGSEVTKIDRATYDKAMTELTNRVDSVMAGLFQIGIHSVRLNTKELAELYYNFNNPDTAVREPLVDFSKLATLYVKKGEQTS